MTLQDYVAIRVALARAFYEESDRRYLLAYRAIKVEMLRQHGSKITCLAAAADLKSIMEKTL